MLRLPDPRSAARWCREQRARYDNADDALGYVPTMGALHRGHLSLIERAARDNRAVCASIFVNPLQFDDAEDLRAYPRDEKRDHALLARAGCDMVFTGSLADFFPDNTDAIDVKTNCDASPFMRDLEATHRPGHLQGVRAIVERLFATVGACNAYFGAKDFQQTRVVAELARAFDGIRVIVCPTVREASGLALSSRNQRLDADGRAAAAMLYQALCAARAAWRDGERDANEIESVMREALRDPRITIEYAAVRDAKTWDKSPEQNAIALVAAVVATKEGPVRLIDNLKLS